MRWIFILALLLAALTSRAADYSPPASNSIPWSRDIVGVPGGIPNRTTIYTNLSPIGNLDGFQIQSAIDNCPSNQVVFLNAGTYTILTNITPGATKGVTLRGSGATTCILTSVPPANGNGLIEFAANTSMDSGTLITNGLTQNSSNLVLISTAGFEVGELACIRIDDNTNLVWHRTAGDTRSFAQMVQVTAINSSTVSIWPMLYVDYTPTNRNPKLHRLGGIAALSWLSGIEDLQINYSIGGIGQGIYMEQFIGCWVKNVRSLNVPNRHIYLETGLFHEVRDCYLSGAQGHGPDQGVGVDYIAAISGGLIENNTILQGFPAVWYSDGQCCNLPGCSGNVCAYNYGDESYQTGTPDLNGMMWGSHGGHNHNNLYEGNIGGKCQPDGYFGSVSAYTIFRNYFFGKGFTAGTVDAGSVWINRWGQSCNVLCNILGYSGMTGYIQTNDNAGQSGYVFMFGYPNSGNSDFVGGRPPNAPVNPGNDQSLDWNVYNSVLVHGNFDYFFNRTSNNPAIAETTFPSSYYLTSKPSWFSNITWPPIGPEVNTNETFETNLTFITNPARERAYARDYSNPGGGGQSAAGGIGKTRRIAAKGLRRP